MKKFLSIFLAAAVLAVNSVNAFAELEIGRTRDEGTQQDEIVQSAEPAMPKLSDDIAKELEGYIVLKEGSDVVFENGVGVKTNAAPFLQNDVIFIPLAHTAEFFGKTAVWNEGDRSVTIDEEIIHPSENTFIKDGRTMINPQTAAQTLGVNLIYNENNVVILGKEELKKETLDALLLQLRDTFYVVSDTSEVGDGTLENPFGGIKNAVEQIREITRNGMSSDINVYLRGGLYSLRETIEFTNEDSGKNGYRITYQSYPGETAEIAGAEKITNWKESSNGIYTAKIDPVQTVNMLYENDRFAVKARYPNVEGEFRDCYLKSAGVFEGETNKFYFNTGDIPYMEDISGLQVAMFGGGEAGLYNWVFEIHNATIDYRSNILNMNAQPRYVMGAGSRYYIQGCKELLDCEGEYWYDEPNKTIYYKPYNGDIESQTITYATVSNLITITGTEQKPVENLSFKNLKIGKSNIRSEWGEGTLQSNVIKYANNCSFEDCEFLYTGGDALTFNDCNDCTVKGNYMHDLGSGAVAISNTATDGVVKYKNIVVTDNYIDNVGIVKRDSSGITLGNADRNVITHNLVRNIPRAGISFGTGITHKMKVGSTINGKKIEVPEDAFEFGNTKENYIAYNDISNCVTDTQDSGPIYTWGAGMNNRIENNHIHDSNIYFSLGYGIYNDDCTPFTTYRKNIVDSLQKEGGGSLNAAMITKSSGHQIINNFFLNNPSAVVAYSTETKLNDEHKDIVYMKNVTMNSSDYLHGQWKWYDDRFKVSNYNYYYNDSGKYLIENNEKAKNLEEWKQINTDYGYMDAQSISGENPDFVDYENGDYRFRYDSKAYSIGIEDIDEKNIGVTQEFKYADREEELKKLYLETTTDGLSANVRLKSGAKSKIIPSARTINGYFANLDNAAITYSSSDENVASVDETGVITALNTGIAEITVEAEKNGKKVSSVIYVLVNDNFESVNAALAQSVVDKGTQTELICSANSSMGYSIPITDYTYKSMNENVAVVNEEGKVTAVNPGKAEIVVSAVYNGVTNSDTVEITVLNGVLKNIDIQVEKKDAIIVGEKLPITVSATLTTGDTVNNDDCIITYASNDENVVVVDENGVMNAVGEGRTSVSVYMEKDGYKINNSINVAVFEEYSGTLREGFKEVNFGTSHGYADFDGDKLLIRATGNDFFGNADDGYYLYKEMENKPNVSLEMTVDSLYNTSPNAAVGLSIRESAQADSRHVTIRVKSDGGIICLWRDETGGSCGYAGYEGNGFPSKLKIEKAGNIVNMYIDKGNGYELLTSREFAVSSYTVGIPVFAQNELSTETVLSNFVINE